MCVFFVLNRFLSFNEDPPWRLIYFLKLGSLEVDDEHNYSGRKVPSLNCCWVFLLLLLLFVVHVQVFDFFNFSHALFNGGFDCRPSYSGQKAPSLKIDLVCFLYLYFYFLGVDFRSYTDWFAAWRHVLCCLTHCLMADSIVGLVCFH